MTALERLRGLLASDVYSGKGRLRSDDLLIREKASHSLAEGTAHVRELISVWRRDRVPPSTRAQPFPPTEAMEPIRAGERLCLQIDDLATTVRGLPLLNADKVWDRVRGGIGLDDLLQFDLTLVGEAAALAETLAAAAALDELPDVGNHLRQLREVITSRRRYAEILG